MKKISILFFVILFATGFIKESKSQTFIDDFTGLAIDTLSGQDNWMRGGSGTAELTIENADPLVYSGYSSGGGEYAVMPVGISGSCRVFKLYSNINNYTGTTFYVSFLLRLTSASANSVGYFISLGDSAGSTSSLAPKIYATANGSGYNIGLAKTTTGVANGLIYGTTVLNFNETYLIVVRYTFNSAGTTAPEKFDDEAYLWVNPDLTSEPLTDNAECTATVGGLVGSGDTDFDGFNSIAGGVGSFIWHNRGVTNPAGSFDGIRIGNGTTSTEAWADLSADVVPVELTSFSASVSGKSVTLNWSTATEVNNSGFDIERKSASTSWQKITFVQGNGTTTQPQSYSYTDKYLNEGKYSYRLKQVDLDGTFEYSKSVEINITTTVDKFELAQNYPNPFNPATKINFSLPEPGNVKLTVYNLLGQEVRVLVNGFTEAGTHTIDFAANNLSSGIYLYKIEANGFIKTKKMTLLK